MFISTRFYFRVLMHVFEIKMARGSEAMQMRDNDAKFFRYSKSSFFLFFFFFFFLPVERYFRCVCCFRC